MTYTDKKVYILTRINRYIRIYDEFNVLMESFYTFKLRWRVRVFLDHPKSFVYYTYITHIYALWQKKKCFWTRASYEHYIYIFFNSLGIFMDEISENMIDCDNFIQMIQIFFLWRKAQTLLIFIFCFFLDHRSWYLRHTFYQERFNSWFYENSLSWEFTRLENFEIEAYTNDMNSYLKTNFIAWRPLSYSDSYVTIFFIYYTGAEILLYNNVVFDMPYSHNNILQIKIIHFLLRKLASNIHTLMLKYKYKRWFLSEIYYK